MAINLWASRRFDEILSASDLRPVLARQAASEAIWIEDQGGQREAIPTAELAAAGRIEIWSPIDNELDTLIALAVSLGDGEAASLAIGHGRRLLVATDDRPARRAARSLVPPVSLRSTSELMRTWSNGRLPTEVANVLARIETGARFLPTPHDPNAHWWTLARTGDEH